MLGEKWSLAVAPVETMMAQTLKEGRSATIVTLLARFRGLKGKLYLLTTLSCAFVSTLNAKVSIFNAALWKQSTVLIVRFM